LAASYVQRHSISHTANAYYNHITGQQKVDHVALTADPLPLSIMVLHVLSASYSYQVWSL